MAEGTAEVCPGLSPATDSASFFWITAGWECLCPICRFVVAEHHLPMVVADGGSRAGGVGRRGRQPRPRCVRAPAPLTSLGLAGGALFGDWGVALAPLAGVFANNDASEQPMLQN